MSNNSVNLIGRVKANIQKNKLKPVNPVLDGYRNDIVAIHKAGFTWEQTAQQVNEAFNLKGKERLNSKTIVSLVKKWEALHWIDLMKVEEIVKDIKSEDEETPKKVDAVTTTVAPAVSPATTNNVANHRSVPTSINNPSSSSPSTINPSVTNPAVASSDASRNVDTYKTVQEFILDAVKLSNPKLHAKDLIEDTFHAYKGKTKREMLDGLAVVLSKRTNR